MKKYFPLIFLFFFFVPKAHAANFSYYRSITVTSTASVASGTNSNFPMLVSSTVSSWAATSSAGRIQNLVTAPNGTQEPADLIFVTSTPSQSGSVWSCATPLNFETEKYVSSTGALIDWVNVPTLATSTVIYACYGATSVTTDQSHPSSTWNTGYQFLYHFPTIASGLNGSDSTQFANNITSNVSTSPTSTAIIDGGAFLAASSLQNGYVQTAVTQYTEEAWIKTTNGLNEQTIFTDRGTTGQSITMFTGGGGSCGGTCGETAGSLTIGADGSGLFIGDYAASVNVDDGVWHQVVGEFNQASGTAVTPSSFTLFIDGVKQALTSLNLAGTPNSPLTGQGGTIMGFNNNWGNNLLGTLDELRISTAILSPSWVLTQYNNQNSPSTFYAVGSEQSPSANVATGTQDFFIVGILKLIGKFFLR